tara:strand:+ start:3994 stop:4521 length:528 start_codon:yes stop_codon:yes gene_type:complete
VKPFRELAIQETLEQMQEDQVNIFDNPFRLGSEMFYRTIEEARRLHLEGKYKPTPVDEHLLTTDLGEMVEYEGAYVPLDCPMISEEKDVELNSPKKGGPKKYYVYVKDGDKIKKVTWGDTTGLKVKLGNEKARKSFAARHKCDTANDKTSARYWACRLPYYAKQLGLSDGGKFFW